ncbi:MAG: hypothetical protein RLY86_510 [Pseudomonadota bacterium]|jgi:2-keto-4-pentenoate hydratase/2-oxohepta-3-ene-1,7-dioic acid hydratase in catechol pathway
MRIARFDAGEGPRPGIVSPDGGVVHDVLAADPTLPADTAAWLAGLDALAPRLRAAAARAPEIPLKGVQLLAPVARPGKILAVGLNYAAHAREIGRAIPSLPACFLKPGTTLAGPFDPVAHPGFSDSLDYEGELVVVIGRGGRHLTPGDAMAAIGGYAVGNDVSLRAFVKPDLLPLGKGLDGALPLGPWITTADAVPDPQALTLRTWVNGEIRQDAGTADMALGCAALVAMFSRFMTLEPGDLILTGSPSGSGAGMAPPRWLSPGDVVRVEIGGLGAIENRIVPGPPGLSP